MGFQYIPDDDTKYVYLYHPDFPHAKRVRRFGPDGPAAGDSEEKRLLMSQGWVTTRYAKRLYHPDHGSMVVKRMEDVALMLEQGWSEKPAEHPHSNDLHRKQYLRLQEQRKKEKAQAVKA